VLESEPVLHDRNPSMAGAVYEHGEKERVGGTVLLYAPLGLHPLMLKGVVHAPAVDHRAQLVVLPPPKSHVYEYR
jgi:hypothetical protein